MRESAEDAHRTGAVRATLASAVEEYCSALDALADAFDHGRPASRQELDRALEAMLQLENAEILFELDVSRRRGAHPASPRRVH
jgi:hypothetical protein